MTKETGIFFIHGGPGFNSFPEKAALEPRLQLKKIQSVFWNEPSSLRPGADPFQPKNSYSAWVGSAQNALITAASHFGPLHVVAHSFGVNAILDFENPALEQIKALTLVCPSVDVHAAYKNVISLAMKDFTLLQPENAKVLSGFLSRTSSHFDEAIQAAFRIAGQDPLLFTHYWKNKDAMKRAIDACQRPGGQMDLDSFFLVNLDLAAKSGELRKSRRPIDLPCRIIFSKGDPVVDQEIELKASGGFFPRMKVELFESSGHYPHLEEPDRFLKHPFS